MLLYRFWQWKFGLLFRRRVVRVEGLRHLPQNRSFLIAANHIDFLDGILVSVALYPPLRRKIVFPSRTSRYRLFGNPTIRIQPDDRAASLDAAAETLQKGNAVCFFIEGERNPTDVLLPPKTGVARLALRSGAPIVPVGLRGPSFGTFLGSLLHTRGVEVHVGEPIAVQKDAGESPEKVQKLLREVAEAVARLAGKEYQDV